MGILKRIADGIAEYETVCGKRPNRIDLNPFDFRKLVLECFPWGRTTGWTEVKVMGVPCFENQSIPEFFACGPYNTPVHGRENQPSEETKMKQPFEVLIIMRPTEEQRKKGQEDKVILGPKMFMAASMDGAKFEAVRELQKNIDLSQVEVLIRPFR